MREGGTISVETSVKPSEVAAVADLICQASEGKLLTDELRTQLSGGISALGLEAIVPHPGSLSASPAHQDTYFLAADAVDGSKLVPVLLRFAPASGSESAIFPDGTIVGRFRPGGRREMIATVIPFGPTDYANIKAFAEQIDSAFLPRPQGSQSAIAVGNRHPVLSLPAAFDAFRQIVQSGGPNLASTVQLSATREMTTDEAISARDGENPVAAGHTRVSIRALFHAGLWAAIRKGWREGYNAEADHFIVTGNSADEIARSVEATKEAIRHAAGYTKFTTDTSRLFELRADERHPDPWSRAEINDRFESTLDGHLRGWLLNEFTRTFDIGEAKYTFSPDETRRLAVKFGPSLLLNEELYDYISAQKASLGTGHNWFDFEPSLDEAETLTTPKELIFYMHWLKARGRAAQLVPPNLGFKKRQAYPETRGALEKYSHHKMWPELMPRVGTEFKDKPLTELAARISELASVARFFDGTLSIHSGSGKQPAVLGHIGRSTGGRWNYKISGELQLQLFDVLSEQPPGSPWRQLYDRMVVRCNEFAARGAFGEESQLATVYQGAYLGDAHAGRTDGNLFLVFWLGNLVGSRDVDSPDGDQRFFQEKLLELPQDLVREVQARNTRYIVWLAENLRG